MYGIEEGIRKINDEFVDTFSRRVSDHETDLEVEAGTTGYRGTPCRKAGGRTYVRIRCQEGDFCFVPLKDKAGTVTGVEIAACGDAGLNAVMKALDFTEKVLNDQRCEVRD